MRKSMEKVLLSTGAGIAGTALIRGLITGTQRYAPRTLPPMKADPGRFMVAQAERLLPARLRGGIPAHLESAFAVLLAFGYGVSGAAGYAFARRRPGNLFLDGAMLGAATWAVSYLGWVPATRLAPPVWRQKPKQIIPNLVSHAIYGIATVGALRLLENLLRRSRQGR